MRSALPAHVAKLLEPATVTVFAAAHDAAIAKGATVGLALVRGFEAVEPQRQVVQKYRCKLELFRKEAAAQVFYAWASVVEKDGVEVVDHEGMSWSAEDMERASWDFCASGGAHGVRHQSIATGSELVGSLAFTADLQKALGIDLHRIGWLVGFRTDDALWQQIESGELPMLSIGGSGFIEDIAS